MLDVDMGYAIDGDVEDVDIAEIKETVNNIKRVKVNIGATRIEKEIIILDNAAEVSVFCNSRLLSKLGIAKEAIVIDGINGDTNGLYCGTTGDAGFDHAAYYNERAIGNILSFGECVDHCANVTYDEEQDKFYVETRGGKRYTFRRRQANNLYTCCPEDDFEEVPKRKVAAPTTVAENLQKYSKLEIKQARKAQKYMRSAGVITAGNLIKLLAAGKIKNADITVQDVVRYVDIWKHDLANLKGKTTAKTLERVRELDISTEPLVRRDQILFIDIMFIEKNLYLVGKCKPSEYVSLKKLHGKEMKHIAEALKIMVDHITRGGVQVKEILCDGESAIESQKFKGMSGLEVDTSGGESVVVIERLIRVVKERVRGIVNVLPYELPDTLLDWLAYSAIYYLNCVPGSAAHDVRSPRERLTGRQLDAKTDLKHEFGQYVQVIDNATDNTMKERTHGGIALAPSGNKEGAWYYMQLTTWGHVKRRRAEELPMPDEVIQYITAKAAEDRLKKNLKSVPKRGEVIKIGLWRGANTVYDDHIDEDVLHDDVPEHMQEEMVVQANIDTTLDDESESADDEQEKMGANVDNVGGDDYLQSAEAVSDELEADSPEEDSSELSPDVQLQNDPMPEDLMPEVATPEAEAPNEDLPTEGRYTRQRSFGKSSVNYKEFASGRRKQISAAIKRVYGLKMTINQARRKLGKEAVKSVVMEVLQLHDTGTFEGVKLSNRQFKKIISSSMFLKDKYTAQGAFEKLKARLVAGGHMQDKSVYNNNTSPTVSTTAVFIVAALAAAQGRAVATIDFPGAFLNSVLPDDEPPVYMRLNKYETQVLVAIDPSYKEFVTEQGTCIVRLKKALYGCIQSARLWYQMLAKDLHALGYKENEQDMCVFNRIESDGTQSTLVLHVDDMMITASTEEHVNMIIQQISEKYNNLSVHRGTKLDYLGMTFDFSDKGKCRVTMAGYVADLLEFCERISGVAKTPASDHLFRVDEKSVGLAEEGKEFFHSATAKLLYLGKRVRPDILTAISFLTKRVQAPTVEDNDKLFRTVRYIRATQELGICLEADKNLLVYGYIDSSYGVHTDMKSHTGCVIGLGKGPVYSKSSTQKLNTKSSCEAELVGISDSSGQVIWVRNFLVGQGYTVGPAVIHHDNTSAIALLNNGKSTSDKTRHIAIRYFYIKDRIDSKEIKLQYLQTGEMIADILTKPLQGNLFMKLRNDLLNW